MIKTEHVLETAEITAIYLRALTDKGIQPEHAVMLTASYISSLISTSARMQLPREPWENPPA